MRVKIGLNTNGGAPYVVDAATGKVVSGIMGIKIDYSASRCRVVIELAPYTEDGILYGKWLNIDDNRLVYTFDVYEFPSLEFDLPSVIAERLTLSDELELVDGNVTTRRI